MMVYYETCIETREFRKTSYKNGVCNSLIVDCADFASGDLKNK